MLNVKINTPKKKMFILLLFIMILYTSYLVYKQSLTGINYWDIFVYLDNAMLFSHINIGSQLSVPPVLSLITSIPFQLGFISETTLFIICGIFFILLVCGVFLIFCEKFNVYLSFIGSLIFSMLSLVVTWSVSGSGDLPSLAFSIWALYFTIRGVKSGFNNYYIAFALFLLSFFTRFTNGFILLVLLCYLIMNKNTITRQLNKNNLSKFIIFYLIVGIIISSIYLYKQGTIPFISQFLEVSSNNVSTGNIGYNLDPWYYIRYLPQLFTSLNINPVFYLKMDSVYNTPTLLSYIMIVLSFTGILIFLIDALNPNVEVKNKKIKLLILLLLSVFTIITYLHLSYLITEILFLIITLLFYKWFKGNINQTDILMILLMGIFIIMYSAHPVKVDRYIIPILIPLTYFMIETIQKIKIKNNKTPIIILTIILLILIPININYTTSLYQKNPHTQLEENTANYIKEYDPNYTNYNISSDRGVAFSWYLKKYTYTTIERVLQENNQTLDETLNQINAKYYIDSSTNLTQIKGYHKIYTQEKEGYKIAIFERD